MCNCNNTYQTTICQPQIPCDQTDCSCPVKDLSTDCILYTGDTLECSGIEGQTILTELIQQLDAYICTALDQANSSINLINVGTGVQIYKGVDVLGKREIRSLKTTNPIITIGLAGDSKEIALGIDETELTNFITENTTPGLEGTGTVNYLARWTPDGSTLGTGLIRDNSTTLSIGTTLDPNIFMNILASKPYGAILLNTNTTNVITSGISAQTNGINTQENRGIEAYSSNSTSLSTAFRGVAVSNSGAKAVAGHFIASGPGVNYAVRLSDGTEGIGKVLTCSTINGEANWADLPTQTNLQRTITVFPDSEYTLQEIDNNYTLIIETGGTNKLINVPSTLSSKFAVAFIQKGAGDVTFSGLSGVTIQTPITDAYTIKGPNYFAYLEQEGSTDTYYLGGNIKV